MLKKYLLLFAFNLVLVNPVLAGAGDPKSIGDIVAGDLGIPGLGWAGHVGIWDGSKVLEVLNDDVVIHKNTLQRFKKFFPYWGARYGKGNNHFRVIRAGWNQRRYNPTYTTTTWWREGGYKRVCVKRDWRRWGRCTKYENKMVKARFRCDTFVDYAYKKGANVNLIRNGGIMNPRSVYYSMPKSR